jgi:hypothetical protein
LGAAGEVVPGCVTGSAAGGVALVFSSGCTFGVGTVGVAFGSVMGINLPIFQPEILIFITSYPMDYFAMFIFVDVIISNSKL